MWKTPPGDYSQPPFRAGPSPGGAPVCWSATSGSKATKKRRRPWTNKPKAGAFSPLRRQITHTCEKEDQSCPARRRPQYKGTGYTCICGCAEGGIQHRRGEFHDHSVAGELGRLTAPGCRLVLEIQGHGFKERHRRPEGHHPRHRRPGQGVGGHHQAEGSPTAHQEGGAAPPPHPPGEPMRPSPGHGGQGREYVEQSKPSHRNPGTLVLKLVEKNHGDRIDIYHVPLDDKTVFKYFQRGWNGDVFHFGAKGLTGYCKLLKPDNINELINCIGLFRPGVMESGFHNKYVARKFGEEDIDTRKGEDEVLKTTLGIMIWQEQTMQLFSKLGGFDMVTADTCRRAIGKKQLEKIVPFKAKFIEHYEKEYEVDEEYAEEAWKEIENMASYQFNKSHAAAYATTGYVCQWLKVHYPLEYWAVAFSYASDDDYPLYLHEINESGNIKIFPPDINESNIKIEMDAENKGLLWSLASIKQVGEKAQQQIIEDREKYGQYFSFEEFLERLITKGSAVNKSVVENLITVGAFDSLENIEYPSQRINLIEKYRVSKGIKVDRSKDIFTLNENKTKYDWWFLLRQKRLCGFAFFDYKQLYSDYFKDQLNDSYYKYKAFQDIDERAGIRRDKLAIGGYVYSKEVKSGKGGEYAIIVLEQNYQFITVMFWSEQYSAYKTLLDECDKNIMFVNGTCMWDERNSQTVLYTTDATDVLLLT